MKFGKPKKENASAQSEEMHDKMEESAEGEVIIEDSKASDDASETSLLQQKQFDELNDRYLRKIAEFDNYQKRTTKEKISRYDDGTRDTIEKLLPIVDNFERAISTAQNKEDSLYKGIDMIYRQMRGYLDDIGIEEIPAKGEQFDANVHMAVSHIEDASRGENEIIEVLQKGYKFKDKIIRPSTVIVAN